MTYNEFIQSIIDSRGQWGIKQTEYYESHHIVPRCLGGLPEDDRCHNLKHENLIWLYPEEHYIAHKLLALEHPDNQKLVCTWHFLHTDTKRHCEVSAEEYAQLKIAFIDLNKKHCREISLGEKNGFYGKHHSDAQKAIWSQKRKGKNLGKDNPNFGNHLSKDAKQRIAIATSTRTKGTKYMYKIVNGQTITKRVHKDEIEKFILDGYAFGRYAKIIK